MLKTRLGNLLMFSLIQVVLYLLLYHHNISIMPENNSMGVICFKFNAWFAKKHSDNPNVVIKVCINSTCKISRKQVL